MLNLAQREHTINHPSENDVFVVEEVAFSGCDEKLSRLSIRTRGSARTYTGLTWHPFVFGPELAWK